MEPNNASEEGSVFWVGLRKDIPFCCCTALALIPILYWINGRAVSLDQVVVRLLLSVLVVGAVACYLVCRVDKRVAIMVTAWHGTQCVSRTNTIAVGLLATHALLVGSCAQRYSFAWTETGLLPAGIIDWRYGTFDVFRVNPPLVRMLATWPLALAGVDVPAKLVDGDPRQREEWSAAAAFIQMHGQRSLWYLTIARWCCLPFSLLGAWVAYRWAFELYGTAAGLGALVLWTFHPMLIGYGCLISGDLAAASLGLLTLYCFRQWLREVNFANSYVFGVAAGLAVLTKTSWLLLFGLLPLFWILLRAGEQIRGELPPGGLRHWLREFGFAIFAVIVALFLINLLYGFQGSFRRLDSYEFISRALSKQAHVPWHTYDYSGNRFQGAWLGKLPVPFPEDLVIGVDLQKWDFDRERWSYLRGEWRDHGWWYYYLYALAIKVPLGIWALILLAMAGWALIPSWRGPWQDEVLLLFTLVVILTLASLETGLNRHLRYVLPIFPLAIVLISRVFRVFDAQRVYLSRFVLAVCIWFIMSSLWVYPHSLSYFNELIGGPRNAPQHLNASNIDWGQDLNFLREWAKRNPDARPLFFTSYLHLIAPQSLGIPAEGKVPKFKSRTDAGGDASVNFTPGWYAIDQESLLRREGDYLYLRALEPIAQVGYSINIYHITDEGAKSFNQPQSD